MKAIHLKEGMVIKIKRTMHQVASVIQLNIKKGHQIPVSEDGKILVVTNQCRQITFLPETEVNVIS